MSVSRRAVFCTLASALALAGCDRKGGDPSKQIGANPVLPEPNQYLLPPMRIAPVVQWGNATPTVAPGLKIEALATGFIHPRTIYTLPNGDILVVESNGPKAPVNRPKDLIMNWVELVGGGGAPGGNRITLLRMPKTPGAPMLRTIFLDHLNSPFGVALVGHDFYVADTDAILRFPYVDGETQITAPGTVLAPLPGGPIDHHWTKSLLASPDGTKLYASVGSNSNITENGIGAELDRADILEVDRATGAFRVFASGLRNPNSMQWEPQSGKMWAVVNERDELGPDLVPDYMTSVKDGGFYGWPYSYYGQHVDPAGEAAASGPGGQGDQARLRAQLACRAARPASSTPAPTCRPNTRAAPSSASMAAGIARRSMATRSSGCRSPTVIPAASRRMWSPASSTRTTMRAAVRSAWPSTAPAPC